MGMTAAERAKYDADLAALAPTIIIVESPKPRGHARGQTDDRRLKDKGARGIPLVGVGAGAIDGTIPGQGSVADLEQAARDIRIADEALAKAKAERLKQVRADIKRGRVAPEPNVQS